MQIKSWQIVLIGVILEILGLMSSVPGADSILGISYISSLVLFFGVIIALLLYFKTTSNIMAFLCIAYGVIMLYGTKDNLLLVFNKEVIFFDSIFISGIYHFRKNIVNSLKQFFR